MLGRVKKATKMLPKVLCRGLPSEYHFIIILCLGTPTWNQGRPSPLEVSQVRKPLKVWKNTVKPTPRKLEQQTLFHKYGNL